jgi:hypothetical protein
MEDISMVQDTEQAENGKLVIFTHTHTHNLTLILYKTHQHV